MIGRKLGAVLAPLVVAGFLSGCVSESKYMTLEQQYNALNQQLSGEIAAQNVRLTNMGNAIRVDVNSELLFPSGGWNMPPEAAQTIGKMAPILVPQQQNNLVVTGYTDNTPIGPELKAQGVPTNLALSQKRADTVANFLVSQGVNPATITAKGMGEANPVAPNSTAAGRAQNRRVTIDIVPRG